MLLPVALKVVLVFAAFRRIIAGLTKNVKPGSADGQPYAVRFARDPGFRMNSKNRVPKLKNASIRMDRVEPVATRFLTEPVFTGHVGWVERNKISHTYLMRILPSCE